MDACRGSEGRGAAATEKAYPLAKSVEIAAGSGAGRGGVLREAKLADLAAGLTVNLTLSADGTTVEGIDWTPDGQGLYLTIIEPEIRDGRFVGSTMRLDRLDLASGTRTPIAQGAAYPTVARDGSRIAYLTYTGGNSPAGMWTARPDGSDARLIVPLGGDIVGLGQARFHAL